VIYSLKVATKVKDSHIFSETSDIKTFLSIYYPLIILKTWHKPSTLITKTMCQFISVVNIADGRSHGSQNRDTIYNLC
jgi:hypothetical protein